MDERIINDSYKGFFRLIYNDYWLGYCNEKSKFHLDVGDAS